MTLSLFKENLVGAFDWWKVLYTFIRPHSKQPSNSYPAAGNSNEAYCCALHVATFNLTPDNIARATRMPDILVRMVGLALDRQVFVRRGKRLEYFTIAWNSLEGIVAVVAGLLAGSISLVGFGVDSFIEVTSGAALLWRMSVDADAESRDRNEKFSLRIVGVCFVALAAYVLYESISDLVARKAPQHSLPGIILACVSLVVMPILSRAKKRVGTELCGRPMRADAKQAEFCAYLSAILLIGLLLNALFRLWWADPVAALVMAPIVANEGIQRLRGRTCDDCQ